MHFLKHLHLHFSYIFICMYMYMYMYLCQVTMPSAGNVTLGPGVTLTCPIASAFLDAAGGLYGPNAFGVRCPRSIAVCAAVPSVTPNNGGMCAWK